MQETGADTWLLSLPGAVATAVVASVNQAFVTCQSEAYTAAAYDQVTNREDTHLNQISWDQISWRRHVPDHNVRLRPNRVLEVFAFLQIFVALYCLRQASPCSGVP